MASMEERIDEYLKNQRIVLWGRAFDLIEGKRKDAGQFILDLLIDLGITYEDVEGECQESKLRTRLEEAVELAEEMVGYVPDFFREKWGFDEEIARLKEAP